MPAARHVLRAVLAGLALGALLVVAAVFFFNRTERGQRIVLQIVRSQIERVIDGTITIDSIRSRHAEEGK